MPKILIVTPQKLALAPFVEMAVHDAIVLALAETLSEVYSAFEFYNDTLEAVVIDSFSPSLDHHVRRLAAEIEDSGFAGQIISCQFLTQALPAIQALAVI